MQGGYRFSSIFESPPECSRWPTVYFGELPRYPSMSNSLLKTWQTSSTWLISVPTINPMILFAKVNWKSCANLDSTVVMSVPNGHVMKSKVPRMLPMDVQRARQTQREPPLFAPPPCCPLSARPGWAEKNCETDGVNCRKYTPWNQQFGFSPENRGLFAPRRKWIICHLPTHPCSGPESMLVSQRIMTWLCVEQNGLPFMECQSNPWSCHANKRCLQT